jgi:cysteinyl-tRNA synthetase
MHNEHLQVEGKKMAKRLGNFYTLRDLLAKGLDPLAIRYLLLSTHYRQQFNFTFEGLDSAKGAIERLTNLQRRLWTQTQRQLKNCQPSSPKSEHALEQLRMMT